MIRLVCQDFQIIGGSGPEAHLRQPRSILCRGGQMFLLNAEFPVLPIGDKRVRDVSESALNGLLIGKKRFLLLRLRQTDATFDPASLKNRLCDGSRKRPQPGGTAEYFGQSHALETRRSGE